MPKSPQRLQVLIANERDEHLDALTRVVEQLGHEIVARGIDLKDVGPLSRQQRADVALVALGLDRKHALDTISEIVEEAACPVIAILDSADPAYVNEAAKRGVFAYLIMDDEPNELENALEITLRRFAEFNALQGAFGRRAIIEQAKGILMERHALTADDAYALLKGHSQRRGQKLIDIADAVTQTYLLRPPTPGATNPPPDI